MTSDNGELNTMFSFLGLKKSTLSLSSVTPREFSQLTGVFHGQRPEEQGLILGFLL